MDESLAPATAGTPIAGTAGARLLGGPDRHERRRARVDRLIPFLTALATLVTVAPLVAIIVFVLARGLPTLDSQLVLNPAGNPNAPGAANAILGSLQMVPVALLIGGGLGLLGGIYLAEFAGRRTRELFGFLVDVLLGVPSIIAGLLVYSTLVAAVGSSALAGSVALSVVMFPVMLRATEEVLRLVPMSIREASLALGVPAWKTVVSIVLRAARAGLLTGAMLAFARGFGETAPLLFTAKGSDALNVGGFGDPMSALPLFVYQNSRVPSKLFVAQAWSAAIVLLAIVLAINVLVRARSINDQVQ
jgi:phosphate transport system permease protein